MGTKWMIAGMLAFSCLHGGMLTFESGVIKGHTEVFGDSTIDPMFKKAKSHLSMEESPLSLRGSIEVAVADFASDNAKRDEHMHETMESSKFPKAVFEVKEVSSKGGDRYVLAGTLNLHGITKPVSFDGAVTAEGDHVRIKATSAIKMSDFGITPPKMMFLTVRDQVDLSVDAVLKR